MLNGKDLDLAVWLAVFYYFQGARTALKVVGDVDNQELYTFARLSYGISKDALDYLRHHKCVSAYPDFRGLLCCILDDLRVRDRDERDRVIAAWTAA